jgi:hypothetical protein
MGKVAATQCCGKERKTEVDVCCVFTERSNLSFITIEGGEQEALGGETNCQEMN